MGNGSQIKTKHTAAQEQTIQLSLGEPCRIPKKILFDTGSSFISPTADHKSAYQMILDRFMNSSKARLLTAGHTDDVGSTDSNTKLSERRAKGALAVLINDISAWESNFTSEREAGSGRAWNDAVFEIMLRENGVPSDPEVVRKHRELTSSGKKLRETLFGNYFLKLLGSPTTSTNVRSYSPPILACGKQHNTAPGENAESRRVEFFFFSSDSTKAVSCSDYTSWTSPCVPIPPPTFEINGFFVSPSGDDLAGDGTISKPWKTINGSLKNMSNVRKPGQQAVLNVMAGSYLENVILPSNTTLEGISNPIPEISGNADSPTIRIQNSKNTNVKKLKVTNGKLSGIRILGSENVSVKEVEISKNFAPRGGGVAVLNSNYVTIEDSLIAWNKAGTIETAVTHLYFVHLLFFEINVGDGHGGGIYLEDSKDVFIKRNNIANNCAILFGGGVALVNKPMFDGVIEIFNNEITCNQVSHFTLPSFGSAASSCQANDMGDPIRERLLPEMGTMFVDDIVGLLHGIGIESGLGGGIALRHVSPKTCLIGNHIGSDSKGNRARRGGGISCFVGAYPYLEKNTIIANLASADGGGMAIDQFDPFFPDNDPKFFSFSQGQFFPRQLIRLVDTKFLRNASNEDGGGIYATGGVLLEVSGTKQSESLFEDNKAAQNGGGIRISYATRMTSKGTSFKLNKCNADGSGKEGGGGIAARNATVHLESCNFQGNIAHNFAGGAVYFMTSYEGGFGRTGFIENQYGQFDEIMKTYHHFGKRQYEVKNCSGSDNEATGDSGAGGFLYSVRSSKIKDGSLLGGALPIETLIKGSSTAIGANTSKFKNDKDPSIGTRKRGNVVIELSGQLDSSGRPQDRVTIFGDVSPVPTGVSLSIPAPDEKAITIINSEKQDKSTDDQPNKFPYSNVGPIIMKLDPHFGPPAGGTPITILGSDFLSGTTVFIDNQPAADIQFLSSDKITARTPPLLFTQPPKPVDVEVRNPDGKSSNIIGGFNYVNAPTISSSKGPGNISGGKKAVIIGTGFMPGASVFFGSLQSPKTMVDSDTQITAVTPPSPSGRPEVVDVTVQNSDGQLGTLKNAFTYSLAPMISDIQLPFGPINGGSKITITGANFDPSADVTIGLQTASDVKVILSTKIEVVTPSGTAGTVDIVVTNPDGQQSSPPGTFEYALPPKVDSINPTEGPSTSATMIQISGSGFRPEAIVEIGGQKATSFKVVSDVLIEAETPSPLSPGPADVEVINKDGQRDKLPGGFVYL